MSDWWVKLDGEEFGPIDAEGLRCSVEEGAIGQETLVKREDGPWIRAGNVKGLFDNLSPAERVADPAVASPSDDLDAEDKTSFIPNKATLFRAITQLKILRGSGYKTEKPNLGSKVKKTMRQSISSLRKIGDDARAERDRAERNPMKTGFFATLFIGFVCLIGWLSALMFAGSAGGSRGGDIYIAIGGILFLLTTILAVLFAAMSALYEIVNELRRK